MYYETRAKEMAEEEAAKVLAVIEVPAAKVEKINVSAPVETIDITVPPAGGRRFRKVFTYTNLVGDLPGWAYRTRCKNVGVEVR